MYETNAFVTSQLLPNVLQNLTNRTIIPFSPCY